MFKRNPAGRSSMRRFRLERRANIRAEWRGWAVLVVATIGCGIWVAVGSGSGRVLAAFSLGAGSATLVFGWVLGGDAHSLRWAWGAWNEQWTAEELYKLDSGWRVYHDIPDGRRQLGPRCRWPTWCLCDRHEESQRAGARRR